jgi:hypothetical protein
MLDAAALLNDLAALKAITGIFRLHGECAGLSAKMSREISRQCAD